MKKYLFSVLFSLFGVLVLSAASSVAPKDDFIGAISIENWDGTNVPSGTVSVESGSTATLKATGLPTGMSFKNNVLSGQPKKEGNYAFVLTAQNANKYKNDKVVAFVTPEHDTAKDPLDWGESYYVGQSCKIYCTNFVSSADTLTMKGLPTGLKLVKTVDADNLPTYWLEGTPTKVGRSTVTWTVKHAQASYSIQYYMIVDGAPSKYIEACADDLPTGCKVTGSGVYAAGAKATLKATAAKGYVFAGWHVDADVSSASSETVASLPAGVDYRNPTLTITDITASPATYYPRFVELKEDFCGAITPTFNDDGIPEGVITVESVSLPTITVSGLPAGLTFNKTTNALVLNEAKMKDGDYAFVISAKNAGGYKNDLVVTFTYGEPEDVPETWPTEYAVGEIIDEPLDFMACTAKDTLKLTGLPTGLKLVTEYTVDEEGVKWPSYSLQGIPTKAGRSTIVWTETRYDDDGNALKGDDAPEPVKYYMTVQGAPSRYIEVVVDGDSPSGSKATGSGVYAAGATVRTTATAPKNCVFAGWYEETNAFDNVYADYLGKDGDYRLASQTWLCGETLPDVLIARFIAQSEDTDCTLSLVTDDGDPLDDETAWDVFISDVRNTYLVDEDGVTSAGLVVGVDSASAPKLTIKGSISGLTVKNYGTWARIYYDPTGKTMPKPGEYTLTFTAVNQSKVTTTRTLTVRVPNVVDEEEVIYPSYGLEGAFTKDLSTPYTVGETVDLDEVNIFGEVPETGMERTITLSGLPTGVTTYSSGGQIYLTGSPTKAGLFTVTVSVKYRYEGETAWSTTSATVFFRVEAIDATCVGTFNGAVYEETASPVDADVSSASEEAGTISATVSAAGKLTSCKLIDLKGKSTSITLKTQAFFAEEGYYAIEGTDKNGEEYVFSLYPAAEGEEEIVTLGGTLLADLPASAREGTRRTGEAQQNVWSDKTLKAEGLLPVFPSKGVTVTYPAEADDPEVTLLFKSGGAVTAKRVVNGKTKSASARFELVTYDAENGWTGVMTVNVPDGTDEGYCKTFDVTVTPALEVIVEESDDDNE